MPNNNKVQFDEPMANFNKGPRGPKESWLTKFVIKLGLAKDAKQATIVLIVVAVVATLLAFVFWPKGTGYEVVPQPNLDLSFLSR